MPENGPSSSWSQASISRMSTTSRSPGCAPSTRNGPESTWTPGSGAWRTSSAESSFLIAPSNHSRQSARNTSPGLTLTFGGMSGCQRLCPTCFWSVNFLVLSSGNRFFGMSPPRCVRLRRNGDLRGVLGDPRALARQVLLGRGDVADLDWLDCRRGPLQQHEGKRREAEGQREGREAPGGE